MTLKLKSVFILATLEPELEVAIQYGTCAVCICIYSGCL